MKLKSQKRLAAQLLKCSKKKICFDPDRLSDIKEAITKTDIKSLINQGAIKAKPVKGISRGRLRKKKKHRKGFGSRKGKKTARLGKKRKWIKRIRIQREFLKLLRDKKIIVKKNYQDLYLKVKGGFFRSKRHIKLYIDEHKLGKKK